MSRLSLILVLACACAAPGAVLAQQSPSNQQPATPVTPVQPPVEPAEAPAVQPSDLPAVPETPRVPLKVKFNDRLAALKPSKPEEYFLLGEEVADEVATIDDRRLAVELFVLALNLDMSRGPRSITGASACLALADLSKSEQDRRWLQFLARTLDPRRVPPEWLARQAPATVESAVYQVATAIGLARSGDGIQARQLLEKPEVREALQGYDRMLANLGGGNPARIVREAERWPCRECQNQRVVRKAGNPPEYKICPACKGDPGPDMTESEFVGQLRFETLLLQGNQRSWAAQIASDAGAPLRDTDPSKLAGYFDVDTSLVLWRDGRWVRDPNAPQPAPAPRQPDAPAEEEAAPAPPASLPNTSS